MAASASAAGESGVSTEPGCSDGYARLRELLSGPERRELEALRAQVEALGAAQGELPQRLGGALEAMRGDEDRARLARALSVPVAEALGSAVRSQRQSLIDALFPVIGPLIRKSIAEALRSLVDDLNRAVESSLTLHGLRWRIEAWRAGVPYAEVVLKHRLNCRIDHLFLIERDSGRVLRHAAAPALPELDADAIGGMLTALGDFVGDSVGADGGRLESAQVGEHLVWIAQGPRANLACFMRGVPPGVLRERLQQRLEEVHAGLRDAPGVTALPAMQAAWDELLQPGSLLSLADADREGERRTRYWPWLLLLAAAVSALVALQGSRWRWQSRVDALRAELAAQPGFLLQRIDSHPWRSLVVRGLLDPDAPSLERALASAGLGEVVPKLELDGFLSTDDAVVARRAARLLEPPPGVRLAVSKGILRLQGSAPAAWVDAARTRAGWVAGVRGTQFSLAVPVDSRLAARDDLARIGGELEALRVSFVRGEAQPEGVTEEVLEAIASRLRRAQALAAAGGVVLRLEALGSNDDSGSEQVNRQVRAARARWLAQQLAERGIGGVREVDAGSGGQRSAWLRLVVESEP